jgi:hypothetical protein
MHTGAFVGGGIGVLLGIAYLRSPTWRYQIVVDEAGLSVVAGGKTRFELAWGEVVSVIAAPAHRTCFVDGGSPERSVLVPGIDAPASYDLTDKDELYRAIIDGVPAERVTEVDSLLNRA